MENLDTIEIIINGTERVKTKWDKYNIKIDKEIFKDMKMKRSR